MARCAIFFWGGRNLEVFWEDTKFCKYWGGGHMKTAVFWGIAEMLGILLRVRFCYKLETWRNRIKGLPTSRFAY